MAEIRVERKRRHNLLPWIVALLLLVLVILGLAAMTHRNRTPVQGDAATVDNLIPPQPPALRQYALMPVTPAMPAMPEIQAASAAPPVLSRHS